MAVRAVLLDLHAAVPKQLAAEGGGKKTKVYCLPDPAEVRGVGSPRTVVKYLRVRFILMLCVLFFFRFFLHTGHPGNSSER